MEEEKLAVKQKSKKSVILIVFLFLIIFGLVFYILYDKEIIFNNKNNVEDKVDEKITDKNKETEITNIDLKKSLSKKIDEITFLNETDGYDYYSLNRYYFNYDSLKKETLTNEDKLTIVLKSSQNNYTPVSVEQKNMDLPSEWEFLKTTGTETLKQIKVSSVKEKYNSLFGLDEINYNSSNNTCPMFIYDKTNQVYYVSSECGGTSAGNIFSYKTNYVKKGDEAFIDVYFGMSLPVDDEKSSIFNTVSKDIPDTEIPYKTVRNIDEQIITKDNYKDFEKYRFTFKLNSNKEYNFVKLERK